MLKLKDDHKFEQETIIHSRIFRPLAFKIVKYLISKKSRVTPNNITIFRIILNFIAILLFYFSNNISHVLSAVVLFNLHELLDHSDGLYARLTNQQSKTGIFLEHFFDVTLSSVPGFLGLSIAKSAYNLNGSLTYFAYFIMICMLSYFTHLFKWYFIGGKNKEGMRHLDHESEELIQVKGIEFRSLLKNILHTMYVWQNQFLLFGSVLAYIFHGIIDIYEIAFIIVIFLNFMSCIYFALVGLKNTEIFN